MESTDLAHIAKKPMRESHDYDMVVFCHLRWEFVYQRPQHIISRMSANRKILFVEEPIGYDPDGASSVIIRKSDNLHILQPRVDKIDQIPEVLKQFLTSSSDVLAWFYSPSFVGLLSDFNFRAVIYDCMDELALFKNAPAKLVDQERYLLSVADIVFTGGKSLYENKKQHHDNVYCFPSSVDQDHFAKAQNGIAVPFDISSVDGPIVGYFGVIDERIDLRLLEETASLKPDVQFVMIGPLAKISESELPRRANIHYLGMKSYEQLPAYIKAFSVAMMPFALNDATKYISPTKTLEYMAAGKPIISTAIRDVVRDYSHCVPIVATANDFSNALDEMLNSGTRLHLQQAYDEILLNTSWDNTAAIMSQLINKTVLG